MAFDGNVGAGPLIAKPYPRIMFAACTRMPFPRAREGRLPAVSPGNPAYAVHREDACQFYFCQALNKRSLSMSWKVAESLRYFRVAKGRVPRLMRCNAGLSVAVILDGYRLEGWGFMGPFASGSHGSPERE